MENIEILISCNKLILLIYKLSHNKLKSISLFCHSAPAATTSKSSVINLENKVKKSKYWQRLIKLREFITLKIFCRLLMASSSAETKSNSRWQLRNLQLLKNGLYNNAIREQNLASFNHKFSNQ